MGLGWDGVEVMVEVQEVQKEEGKKEEMGKEMELDFDIEKRGGKTIISDRCATVIRECCDGDAVT